MDAGDSLGNRQRLHTCDHMLDESLTPRSPCARCSTCTVQQLADGDDADRAILVADKGLERSCAPFPLPVDQEPRVDQDGQEFSGGRPASRRISRRSSANSSSTGGADASSSRNRAAGSSRGLGGAISATGAPARVTSISSPAATRLKTAEKFRATSVAVNRATKRRYQINLIVCFRTSSTSPRNDRRQTGRLRSRKEPCVVCDEPPEGRSERLGRGEMNRVEGPELRRPDATRRIENRVIDCNEVESR